MFDKRLCIANIYQLAKERSIKIGDLEKTAGVSTGYLSRINKEDNSTIPTIDFIAAVAKELGMTVDAIINNDYANPTPTEKYILSFIDRLLAQTNADELDWKKETPEQLSTVGVDEDGDPTHPLYQTIYDGCRYDSKYYSHFDPQNDISGDCFWIQLPGPLNTKVYLMCTDWPEAKGSALQIDQYELYIVKSGKVQPMCCSCPVNSLFYSALTSLYSAVKESCNHPKLDRDVMSAIELFMKGETEDFGDGQLPF